MDTEIQKIFEEAKNISGKKQFCFYGQNKRDFMFIMQNPGNGLQNSRRDSEFKKIKESDGLVSTRIKIHQEYLINWLINNNKHFAQNFFYFLKDKKITLLASNYSKNDWEKYYKIDFLNDFYVTDLVKVRAKTSDCDMEIKKNSKQWENILKREIEYCHPKFIFVFGSRTWNSFYKSIFSTELQNHPDCSENVKDNHGKKIKLPRGITIIPLVHFSQQLYNNLISDSYWAYLHKHFQK